MHDDPRQHHDDSRRRDSAEAEALRLERWLAAEAGLAGSGSDADRQAAALETADEALFALFEALPPVAPPAGFAERVLARAGVVANPWVARLWRLAVSLAVLLTGGAVLLLPALGQLTPAMSWSAPLRLVSELLVGLGEVLESVLSVLQDMAWLSGVLGRAAASPTGAMSLAVALAVASLAFRLLLELDARDRSWSHAETI